jgi:hypothetical protein
MDLRPVAGDSLPRARDHHSSSYFKFGAAGPDHIRVTGINVKVTDAQTTIMIIMKLKAIQNQQNVTRTGKTTRTRVGLWSRREAGHKVTHRPGERGRRTGRGRL